jgi:hypothetical protein
MQLKLKVYMGKLIAIYRRSHTIGSVLIRLASWFGPYSHVGVLTADGSHVIEASAFKGVVRIPLTLFIQGSSKYEVQEIECPNPDKGLAFIEAQIGKPYDWGAIFGMVARQHSWEDVSKWYCSELLEATIQAAGRRRVRIGFGRITVDQSYIIE